MFSKQPPPVGKAKNWSVGERTKHHPCVLVFVPEFFSFFFWLFFFLGSFSLSRDYTGESVRKKTNKKFVNFSCYSFTSQPRVC